MTQMQEVASEQSITPETDFHLSESSLPMRATFFPLGFPVAIATNSSAVLEAASRSWANFEPKFEYPPLSLHLEVTRDADTSTSLPPAPGCRAYRHLLSNIADANNFTHCDLNTGIAFGRVTERTVESSLYFRYHILEATVLCMIGALRTVPLHAACVSSNGFGMLLCGDSGVGKSSLAFAGSRFGWVFTSDDASYLLLDGADRTVLGNCHQFRLRGSGPQLFPELEGRSITPRASGKPSIEIPTAELPGIATSESAQVQSIIFLNRSDGKTPELIRGSQKHARSWFSQFPYPGTSTYKTQQEAIDRLLEAPVFELRYTDLDWAIERLNTLARTGN
jgi:hypothetical protein